MLYPKPYFIYSGGTINFILLHLLLASACPQGPCSYTRYTWAVKKVSGSTLGPQSYRYVHTSTYVQAHVCEGPHALIYCTSAWGRLCRLCGCRTGDSSLFPTGSMRSFPELPKPYTPKPLNTKPLNTTP